MIEKIPEEFLSRMKVQLGSGYDEFLKSYSLPVARAVRVNTLKISAEKFEELSPLVLDGKVPWEQNGYYVQGEGLGKTVLYAAGAYYVQEPSAMCAVPEMGVRRGERVLDLCAAPGGKTTQIASYMGGDGLLVANEINYERYNILKSNLERAGVKNAVVLNKNPKELSEIFINYFDRILVDAPCSGEGMFKKEENAIPEWSVGNVRRCAERQSEILDCADLMLSGGGRLVYSTCTFSQEEDERQIENFLSRHPDYYLLSTKKLYPHEVRGEGHFCAVLQKGDGSRGELARTASGKPDNREREIIRLYREWESSTLKTPIDGLTSFGTNNLYKIIGSPELARHLRSLGVSAGGLFLGGVSADGKRFEPSHRLVMSLKSGDVRNIEVDERTALDFLHGLTFGCASDEKGWRAVTFHGLPLGWCKAVGGVAKNHLPKGLRI